jgi:hypothetical protein
MNSSGGYFAPMEFIDMPLTESQPEAFLTPSDIAKELNLNPSAPIRWARKGACLSDGTRLRLMAVRAPHGWRIKRSWLDEFLGKLTADRTGPGAPRLPGFDERADRAMAALEAADNR